MRLRTVTAAVLLALGPGCRDRDATAPQAPAAPAARPGDRYTVRGEILRLPAPGASPREITIRHEAIPDFRTASGAAVGMKAMVMPFQVAAAVPLDGLAPGDKIRFRFVMDWASSSSAIESIERLPADTALDYGAR